MDVIINALQFKQNSSGIGVMIRDLFSQYITSTTRQCMVILAKDSPNFPCHKENVTVVRIPYCNSQNLGRLFFQTFALGRHYCRNKVFMTTDSKIPFFMPKDCFVIPIITDLAVYRMQNVYRYSRVFWWKLQYSYVKRRANHFLAISEFTKREMTDLLKIPPENIDVIPCACASNMKRVEDTEKLTELRRKYKLPFRFALFVGNSNPRKNLERMIRAFDLAKMRGELPQELIIAGEQGWKFSREEALQGICHPEAIRFIGFVDDEDMPALYSAAELFVFPTIYEGFGIPVLEAQSCGTPVLTSNCSALPEVGGSGAIYVDPNDVEQIAAGILRILQNVEDTKKMVSDGYQNVKRFSWAASAAHLNQIVEEVVER